MSMDPQDNIISGSSSNCCEAPMYLGDICSACLEPCCHQPGEDEEGPSDATQEAMRESAHLLMEAYRKTMIDAGRGHLLPP